MANAPVSPPLIPNKQLYNGGSEWQNDYANNFPDYYQTFYRNYDAAIGRFIGVDPNAESAESMTSYQYAGDNPIMNNDPMGNKLDISRQNSVSALPMGPGRTEFDYSEGELFWGTLDLLTSYGGLGGASTYGDSGGAGSLIDGAISGASGMSNGYASVAFDAPLPLNNALTSRVVDQNGNFVEDIPDGSNAVYQIQSDGSLKFAYYDESLHGVDKDYGTPWWINQANVTSSRSASGGQTASAFLPNSTELRTSVDRSTLGRNIFHTNYIGPSNPLDHNGNYNYDMPPSNKADRPAMFHDLAYDKLNITGASGMIFSTKALGADATLIKSELAVTVDESATLTEKSEALVVALGVFYITTPKGLFNAASRILNAVPRVVP